MLVVLKALIGELFIINHWLGGSLLAYPYTNRLIQIWVDRIFYTMICSKHNICIGREDLTLFYII